MKNQKGYFITFEGPDGSGKSTQIKMLAAYLKKRGCDCVVTREPGGTEIGEKMRDILKDNSLNRILSVETEVLLLQVSRAQHVHELIRPSIENGRIVLCDRFADSSVAYQGAARGIGVDKINSLNNFSTSGLDPDLTILLDLDVRKGLGRSAGRQEGTDRFEQENLHFHDMVRNEYLRLARKYPQRIKIVSADATVEQVHEEVVKIVDELIWT